MAKLIEATSLLEQVVRIQASEQAPEKKVGQIIMAITNAPIVDAAPVVRRWWKEYSHSALVNWKNGEPVWADRAVYRCSGCDFGTIIKHNYCPRCGANMMDGGDDR